MWCSRYKTFCVLWHRYRPQDRSQTIYFIPIPQYTCAYNKLLIHHNFVPKRKLYVFALCFRKETLLLYIPAIFCLSTTRAKLKNGTGVSGVTIQIDCVINYGLYKRYRGHYFHYRLVVLLRRLLCVYARTKGYCCENNDFNWKGRCRT